ncbi:glutaredoxin family protein [Alkalihalobacillus oceani]|nr:glutaredoxin family protein [Halalkalibacter oceani]MCM3760615.1 glutaredoxin family protein [Halalkalibacter oceani]
MEVELLSKTECPLCDKAVAVLEELKRDIPFTLTIIDIYQDDQLLEEYQIMIPVVRIGTEEVDFGQISKEKVRKRLLERQETKKV